MEKRTFGAKATGGVAGVLTLGVVGAAVPLLAKKRLRCKLCGTYNKTGNVQAYRPAPAQETKQEKTPVTERSNAQHCMETNQTQRAARSPGAPSTGRSGQYLQMKKPMKP